MWRRFLLCVTFIHVACAWKLWPQYEDHTWSIQVVSEGTQDDESMVAIDGIRLCEDDKCMHAERKHKEQHFQLKNGLRTVVFETHETKPMWAVVHLKIRNRHGVLVNDELCSVKLNQMGERATTKGIKVNHDTPKQSLAWTLYLGGAFVAMVLVALIMAVLPEWQAKKRLSNVLYEYDFETGKQMTQEDRRKQKNRALAQQHLTFYKA